jgi:gamma-glutamyltranspeptidase/glutathione hydrolase
VLRRGAIAAGHPLTAEVGARVLRDGGNAVDACIAAAFASWVTESTLTGPGSGGFMLVHRAADRTTRVLDFFVSVPGLGGTDPRPRHAEDMETVDVDYTPESSQVFRIGAASCAVPGTVAGLSAAHRSFATRPWRELVEPAIELARDGVVVTHGQAYLHEILDPILRHTEEGRAIYGCDGQRLGAGDRLVMTDLAATMARLGEHGAADFYEGALAHALASYVQERGGSINPRDLADYRVIRRRPISSPFLGHVFDSNPPPSTGGVLIGYGLRLLDRLGVGGPPGSAEAMARLASVMLEQARARGGRFTRELYRGGLARRLFDEEALAAAAERARFASEIVSGTTHISVVDGDGNAAALTATTGTGSGIVVPGTGVQLNNMLGEFDLGVTGAIPRPGRRLTSMMAPSVVLHEGRTRLVVGSAGSLRLRGAILQIVVNVVGHGLPVTEAVDRPRIHVENGEIQCEGGADEAELERLAGLGFDLVRWQARNLYFGGAAAVEVADDGGLAAAGDPRRGGAGLVVE